MSGTHLLVGLHPAMRAAVEYLGQWADAYKLAPTLTSGFRDAAKQAQIRAGRASAASPGRSAHQYGLGVDVVSGNGRMRDLAQLAQVIGFEVLDEGDHVHVSYPGWRRAVGL